MDKMGSLAGIPKPFFEITVVLVEEPGDLTGKLIPQLAVWP